MLTADLVRARRLGNELKLPHLGGRARARAEEIAGVLLTAARGAVGRSRDELREALAGVDILARERRLRDGLAKLIEDRCEFAVDDSVDPVDLRREVFSQASVLRRTQTLERDALLGAIAVQRGLSIERVERALYADLHGAHQVLTVPTIAPDALLHEYEGAEQQAVLLRAVRVTARVFCRAPDAYRSLLRQLKFRRLLYTVTPVERGYRLEIDGPLSLFESVTKYGLGLALSLPALQACDELDLEAQVRWGTRRTPVVFRHSCRGGGAQEPDPALSDEVRAVLDAFANHPSGWRASVSDRILQLPGVGLCVPDLVFERPDSPHRVYFELLGTWSRDAVWQRVELVQRGLGERILFAASQRLRVSEAVLGDEQLGALLAYRSRLGAGAIARKLDALAGR